MSAWEFERDFAEGYLPTDLTVGMIVSDCTEPVEGRRLAPPPSFTQDFVYDVEGTDARWQSNGERSATTSAGLSAFLEWIRSRSDKRQVVVEAKASKITRFRDHEKAIAIIVASPEAQKWLRDCKEHKTVYLITATRQYTASTVSSSLRSEKTSKTSISIPTGSIAGAATGVPVPPDIGAVGAAHQTAATAADEIRSTVAQTLVYAARFKAFDIRLDPGSVVREQNQGPGSAYRLQRRKSPTFRKFGMEESATKELDVEELDTDVCLFVQRPDDNDGELDKKELWCDDSGAAFT